MSDTPSAYPTLCIVRCCETIGDFRAGRHDHPPTPHGIRQNLSISNWIGENLDHGKHMGYCAPDLASLYTASALTEMLGTPFTVNPILRDVSFEASEQVILRDRSTLFSNLTWPASLWKGEDIEAEGETPLASSQRLLAFVKTVGTTPAIVVAPTAAAVVISQHAAAASAHEIHEQLADARVYLRTPDKRPRRQVLHVGGMAPGEITLIAGGEVKLFAQSVM